MVAVFDALPSVAEMMTLVFADGVPAVTVNVLLVAPAGIVTVSGTEAAALFEESPISMPPVGAGPEILTVATAVRVLMIVVGEIAREESLAGVTVRTADLVALPRVA